MIEDSAGIDGHALDLGLRSGDLALWVDHMICIVVRPHQVEGWMIVFEPSGRIARHLIHHLTRISVA